jgi:hypothetical protein
VQSESEQRNEDTYGSDQEVYYPEPEGEAEDSHFGGVDGGARGRGRCVLKRKDGLPEACRRKELGDAISLSAIEEGVGSR